MIGLPRRPAPPPGAGPPTVAVFPGDDAAPEAVDAALFILEALAPPVRVIFPDSKYPERATVGADAVLFGAASRRAVPIIFHLRWGLGTYANVRPVRWFAGLPTSLASPQAVDLIVVRENLEDAYVGVEGAIADLAPLRLVGRTTGRPLADLGEGAYAVKVITRAGSERVIRRAFELARARRGRLTVTAKWNMLPRADGLFLAIAQELASDYRDVRLEALLVDDCACRMAADTARFDVLVTPNLYGDILSDLAAGLVGGLGTAASGCYGDDFAYFESVHGTAPDLVGLGTINPTATIMSAALLLDYLDLTDHARRLRKAVVATYADGRHLTPDCGGRAGTKEFATAVRARL